MVPLASSFVMRLRATLGISQAELAKLAGISRHTVMRAENGRTVSSPLVQAALARVAEDYLNSARQAVSVPIQPGRLSTMKKVKAKRNGGFASGKERVKPVKPAPAVRHSKARSVS